MLIFERKGRTGRIVIDRPEAGNAFTSGMIVRLAELLRAEAAEADILILTGAGADFTIGRDRHEPKSASPFDAFRAIGELNRCIAEFPGIIVAGVRGRATGLGVGLIMRSDIAIAADDARLSLDEVAHGIPPMFIMEAIVEHLPGKRALEMILSGRSIAAQEALDMGLLSRVVPAADLDKTLDGFASELAARDRDVILACKRYLRSVARLPVEARPAFALVEQTEFTLRAAKARAEPR